jgi:hypothetical protein
MAVAVSNLITDNIHPKHFITQMWITINKKSRQQTPPTLIDYRILIYCYPALYLYSPISLY